jgi:hypothetical protein
MDDTKPSRRKVRSETVTVRLDPKLRYLAELAARKQRRTLSSYIEWAIEVSLAEVNLDEGEGWNNKPPTTVADVALQLWDVEEADRFAKLALSYPDLLTHHESVMWKVLREWGYFWRGNYDDDSGEWTFQARQDSLVWGRLREYWLVINAIATGTLDRSALPDYKRTRPRVSKPGSDPAPEAPDIAPIDDEDIPF